MARDVSEGGVFVQYRDDRIRPGSKIKLTVLNPNSVDAHATPTVELTVRRVDEQGMGLEFLNRTGRHLWQSVDRLRSELAVGRDYFQLHVSALAMNDRGDLLLVQNNGKWQFPGFYLTVGTAWREALSDLLSDRFKLKVTRIEQLIGFEVDAVPDLPEAAVAKLFAVVLVDDAGFQPPDSSRYRACRWIKGRRDIEESTFADPQTRSKAGQALDWFRARETQ